MAAVTRTIGEAVARGGNRAGRWATSLLVKRHLTVFLAERSNIFMLILQPLLIGALISLVAVDNAAIPKKLFLGYIAALWLGCSNAAQVIVRERAIFMRERLAGLRLHNYLISKFSCLGLFAVVQSLLLFAMIKFTGTGLIGDPLWQLAAIAGSSLAMSGLGLLISAYSKTPTYAVMAVPLVIIPQILFSGYVFGLQQWSHRRLATVISRVCPSYAAQRLVDISLFWKKELNYDDYLDVYRLETPNLINLEIALVPWRSWLLKEPQIEFTPEIKAEYSLKSTTARWPAEYPEFEIGSTFTGYKLSYYPIGLLCAWYVLSYLGAWYNLSRRDE